MDHYVLIKSIKFKFKYYWLELVKSHPLLGKVSDAYWSGRMTRWLQWVYEGPTGFEPLPGFITMFLYLFIFLAAGTLQDNQ